jgi:hypothetical protein
MYLGDGCLSLRPRGGGAQLPPACDADYPDEYPRWFFSNLSEDIRALFCAYCDRVGVRLTHSEPPEHLDLPLHERGAARRARRPEGISGLG